MLLIMFVMAFLSVTLNGKAKRSLPGVRRIRHSGQDRGGKHGKIEGHGNLEDQTFGQGALDSDPSRDVAENFLN